PRCALTWRGSGFTPLLATAQPRGDRPGRSHLPGSPPCAARVAGPLGAAQHGGGFEAGLRVESASLCEAPLHVKWPGRAHRGGVGGGWGGGGAGGGGFTLLQSTDSCTCSTRLRRAARNCCRPGATSRRHVSQSATVRLCPLIATTVAALAAAMARRRSTMRCS